MKTEVVTIEAKYLRPKDAAKYLGLGISTFWRLVKAGEIRPGIKLLPGSTVWPVSSLEDFVAAKAAEIPDPNKPRRGRPPKTR